jgi:hypothetical protein
VKILAVVLLLACSSKSEPPPKFDNLQVTLDGKPLAIDRAFKRQLSPDVYGIVMGAGKGSCTEDGTFGFTIAKKVAGTGHDSFVVTELYSRDIELGLVEPIKVKLDGTKLDLPPVMGRLMMRGRVDLVDCPVAPPSGMGAPKVTHPSKARIIVAGKSLDVKGVTVQTRAGKAASDLPNIVISTNVKDCSSVTLPAPIILDRTDGKWTLRGTWLTTEQSAEQAELAFSANDVGKSIDGPTLELQLSGSAKLGDYTVKLDGTAEAIECVR